MSIPRCLLETVPILGDPGYTHNTAARRNGKVLGAHRARSQGSNLWQTHVLALGLARSLRIFL